MPTSSSKVLLQLFLPQPWLLYPCGFHLSACLVTLLVGFLRMCPIQSHLCRLIWMSILCCTALGRSSSFLMTSGQWVPMMDLRHLLTKDCSLLGVQSVSMSLSHTQDRLHVGVDMCSLVFLEIVFDLHTAHSIVKAVLAFPILHVPVCRGT